MANGENPERSYETSRVIGAVSDLPYKVGLPRDCVGRDLGDPRQEARAAHEESYKRSCKEGRA